MWWEPIKHFASWLLSYLLPNRSRIRLDHGRDYQIIKQIGEVSAQTSSSQDLEANADHQAVNALLALKKIKIQLEEQEDPVRREIQTHALVAQHPHVIRLLYGEVRVQDNGVKEGLLLFPFYKQGTVQDWIDRSHHGEHKEEPTVDHIMGVFVGICRGLGAFHSLEPPLAFRDLKPANVLLTERGEAVLMDLGSVAPANVTIQNRKEALSLQELCAETCTAPFRPPELLEVSSNAQLDARTDIWSLGCTLYAMVFGQSPFDGSATSASSGKLWFPSKEESSRFCVTSPIAQLITYLIQVDMKQRPFINDVLNKVQELELYKLDFKTSVR